MEQKEIWKPIPGYIYIEVSNLGRVKKLAHGKIKERIQSTFCIDKDGYCRTSAEKEIGKWTQCSVHRLVALAFIDNPYNKTCVNHINSDRTDNRVENLEWVTPKENVYHSFKYGNRQYQTFVQPTHTLTEYQINNIQRLRDLGFSLKEVSKLYNIRYSTLKNIVIKKRKRERLGNQQPSVKYFNEGSSTSRNDVGESSPKCLASKE